MNAPVNQRTFSGSGGTKGGGVDVKSDNLFSTDLAEVLLGLSEGPIEGLKDGSKSFYIGETPLTSPTGSDNFKHFILRTVAGTALGTELISNIGGFSSSTTVGVELFTATPVVRTGTHQQIEYLDIRLVVNRLVKTTGSGDTVGDWTGQVRLEYKAFSSPDWLPIPDTSGWPEEVTPDGYGIFRSNADLAVSQYGRPLYVRATAPALTTDTSALWFDSNDNFTPYRIESGAWTAIGDAIFTTYWEWTDYDASTRRLYLADTHGRKPSGDPSPATGDFLWQEYSYLSSKKAGTVDVKRMRSWNGSTWSPHDSTTIVNVNDTDDGGIVGGILTIIGKATAPFVREIRVPVTSIDDVYELRVTKLTEPVEDEQRYFDITWESFQEVEAEHFQFPNLACTQLLAQASDQFSSIPDFSGIYRGRTVKVPSNYDAEARTYTGIWDGTWQIAWTNNPAYIVKDLVENDRYGMSAYYETVIDPNDVYDAGQWCDIWVDNDQGGTRPRFTMNDVIQDPRLGREAIAYICGIFGGRFFDDGNGNGRIKIDRGDTPAVAIFGAQNVQDGLFNYSWTEIATRYNDISVTFKNPDLNWKEDRRRVFDQDLIDANGRIPLDFVAVGCRNLPEALARGRYKLVTGTTECMMVNFRTNRQGLYLEPYDIVLIADPDMADGISGRVKQITSTTEFAIRDDIFLEVGLTYKVTLQYVDGSDELVVVEYDIDPSCIGHRASLIVTAALPADLVADSMFAISSVDDVNAGIPKAFRLLTIEEIEGDNDNIEILAIEVNRLKWDFVDTPTDPTPPGPDGDPEPVSNLTLEKIIEYVDGDPVIDLKLHWDPSISPDVDYYRIMVSIDGGADDHFLNTRFVNASYFDAAPGDYEFTVYAVDLDANDSTPVSVSYTVVTGGRTVTPPTGLTLFGEPSSDEFESRSPYFTWDTSEDDFFDTFIFTVDGTSREVETTHLVYRYLFADNATDQGGTAARSFTARLKVRDVFGNESTSISLAVENVVPTAPSLPTLSYIGGVLTASVDAPDFDDYQATKYYLDTSPGATTLEYNGPNTSVSKAVDPNTTYYVRAKFRDDFGDSAYSAEASILTDPTPFVEKAGDTMTGPLVVPAGTVSLPGLAVGAADTGIWRISAGTLGFTFGGVEGFRGNQYGIGMGIDPVSGAQFRFQLISGTSAFSWNGGGTTTFQVIRSSADNAGPNFQLGKARGDPSSPASVVTNDIVALYDAAGYASASYRLVGRIRYVMLAASPSSSDLEARQQTFLCPAGSATLTEIQRLEHATGLSMFGANVVINQNRHYRLRQYAAASLPSQASGDMIGSSDIVAAPLVSDGTEWLSPGVLRKRTVTANTTISVPAGWAINKIHFAETAGNAVTGGIKIGKTSGATDVVVAQAVGANSLDTIADANILLKVFSRSAAQTLFIQAVTAWNSASVELSFVLNKVF